MKIILSNDNISLNDIIRKAYFSQIICIHGTPKNLSLFPKIRHLTSNASSLSYYLKLISHNKEFVDAAHNDDQQETFWNNKAFSLINELAEFCDYFDFSEATVPELISAQIISKINLIKGNYFLFKRDLNGNAFFYNLPACKKIGQHGIEIGTKGFELLDFMFMTMIKIGKQINALKEAIPESTIRNIDILSNPTLVYFIEPNTIINEHSSHMMHQRILNIIDTSIIGNVSHIEIVNGLKGKIDSSLLSMDIMSPQAVFQYASRGITLDIGMVRK